MKWTKVGLIAMLAACGSNSTEPAPRDQGAQSLVEAGIQYRAETLLLESFPVQIASNVHITNQSGAAQTVTFPDGCIVLLRVYRDAARTALAWDAAQHYGCTAALVPVTLAPGETVVRAGPTVSAGEVLRRLPNGRYYFSVLVRPEGKPLEIPAGSADLAK